MIARLRAWWNHRTYRGEVCQCCGRKVRGSTGSWWSADDDLWQHVTGMGEGGILCPPCFTRLAKEKRVLVYYEAKVCYPS